MRGLVLGVLTLALASPIGRAMAQEQPGKAEGDNARVKADDARPNRLSEEERSALAAEWMAAFNADEQERPADERRRQGQQPGNRRARAGGAQTQQRQARTTPQAQPEQADLSDALKKADSGVANLAGADLTFEVVNGQLVIRGAEQHIEAIEAIKDLIGGEERELRVVKVTERDANQIAQAVEDALRAARPALPDNQQPSLQAVSAEIILVSALP
ncbi:MAG: hypothetical protein IID36_10160, partial [Planctomycetes bacterium]|nr:hypothetical protein [Planctomycetota bacterium]